MRKLDAISEFSEKPNAWIKVVLMKLKCLRKCQSRDNYIDDFNETGKYESTFMNKQFFWRQIYTF